MWNFSFGGNVMKNLYSKYFLAANSCEGFISYFDSAYNEADGWRAYIIKGGPGTGKSSFMKYIAAKAHDLHLSVILCPCSSDPDSLDAVIIPDKKIIVFDGTSPHMVEPKFAGAVETILDFGKFWDEKLLEQNRKEIIEATLFNKALHRTASGYLKAVGPLIKDNLSTAANHCNKQKVQAFAANLCKQYLKTSQKSPYEWVRFLGGTTPKGVICFSETALEECENTVIIKDEYGFVSNTILEIIRNKALDQGYEIITVKNPFLPSVLTDGIIIPALSLCFVREYEFAHYKTDCRRIHARRFMNASGVAQNKLRLKFNKKAYREFLASASQTLAQAKNSHDILEKYYIKAMDFESLTLFAKEFANDMLTQ